MDLWHWDTSLVDQFNSKNSINFKSVCSWYGHHNNKLLFLHTITSPHPSPCSAVGISFSVNAAHYTTVHSLNMHMHTLATALSEPLLQTNQLVLRKSDWLRGGKELTAKTPKCNVLSDRLTTGCFCQWHATWRLAYHCRQTLYFQTPNKLPAPWTFTVYTCTECTTRTGKHAPFGCTGYGRPRFSWNTL